MPLQELRRSSRIRAHQRTLRKAASSAAKPALKYKLMAHSAVLDKQIEELRKRSAETEAEMPENPLPSALQRYPKLPPLKPKTMAEIRHMMYRDVIVPSIEPEILDIDFVTDATFESELAAWLPRDFNKGKRHFLYSPRGQMFVPHAHWENHFNESSSSVDSVQWASSSRGSSSMSDSDGETIEVPNRGHREYSGIVCESGGVPMVNSPVNEALTYQNGYCSVPLYSPPDMYSPEREKPHDWENESGAYPDSPQISPNSPLPEVPTIWVDELGRVTYIYENQNVPGPEKPEYLGLGISGL